MGGRKVLILMGSDSDYEVMERCGRILEQLKIDHDMHVASAHRTPDKVAALAREARKKGYGAIIAGAGMAAHLGGVVAAHTTLPVIGVPLASGVLDGLDAMLATAQMPPGVPVACMGVGAAGATNAGLLAAAILALGDPALARRIDRYRRDQRRKVEEKDAALPRGV